MSLGDKEFALFIHSSTFTGKNNTTKILNYWRIVDLILTNTMVKYNCCEIIIITFMSIVNVLSLLWSEKRLICYLQPLARLPNMLLFLTCLSKNRQFVITVYFKKYNTNSTYKHLQQVNNKKHWSVLITYDTLKRTLLLIKNLFI